MTGLPQGWAETTLGTLSEYITSGSRDWSRYYAEEGSLFIRTQDIKTNSLDEFSNIARVALPEKVEGKRTLVLPKDILITITGANVGKVAVVPNDVPEAYVSQSVALVRLCQPEQAQFLQKAIMRPQEDGVTALRGAAYGQGRPVLSLDDVRDTPIPLPPLPEQRRIVRKLDTLSARSTTARTHITAIEKLAERYKSGVLGLELSGVPLGNEADEQNTQPITNDNERGAWTFNDLPSHWVWTGFKAFLENRTDSYRKLPQKEYQSEGRYPVIDQGADLIGGYSNDANILLPAEPPYIIFGDHTRCVKFFEAPFVQGADGVKVFHAGKDVDIRFAYWALKGLQLPDKGYSRHTKFLKESFFPRPPLEEQREIVRRIETAFAKIDRLAAEAAKALKLLGHLDQRILAKAFAGDLVPQDPTDEPAETLLARIREARAAAPKGKRGRKAKA